MSAKNDEKKAWRKPEDRRTRMRTTHDACGTGSKRQEGERPLTLESSAVAMIFLITRCRSSSSAGESAPVDIGVAVA